MSSAIMQPSAVLLAAGPGVMPVEEGNVEIETLGEGGVDSEVCFFVCVCGRARVWGCVCERD